MSKKSGSLLKGPPRSDTLHLAIYDLVNCGCSQTPAMLCDGFCIEDINLMKPTKTRRELHAELQAQVEAYLNQGGKLSEIPRGLSGRPYAMAPLSTLFDRQNQEDRTPIPEVVAAIEARRKPQHSLLKHYKPRPKKKIILDDFGQPLRWEWVDQ
jgi:hypothetical protein